MNNWNRLEGIQKNLHYRGGNHFFQMLFKHSPDSCLRKVLPRCPWGQMNLVPFYQWYANKIGCSVSWSGTGTLYAAVALTHEVTPVNLWTPQLPLRLQPILIFSLFYLRWPSFVPTSLVLRLSSCPFSFPRNYPGQIQTLTFTVLFLLWTNKLL